MMIRLFLLSVVLGVSSSYAQEGQSTQRDLNDRFFADKQCRFWAQEDEIHPDELAQYLAECIEEVLNDNNQEIPASVQGCDTEDSRLCDNHADADF